MKLRTTHLTGTLLAAAVALAAFAPGASAGGHGSHGGHRSQGHRGYDAGYDNRYDSRGYGGSGYDEEYGAGYYLDRYGDGAGNSGRSYFYREVATGRTNDYISALRPHWGCRGTSPVEMIDKRSGCLLHTYFWSGTCWDDIGGGGYARYDGRGRGYGGGYGD